jgi:large subunit ribosomal protein L21
MYAVIETGGKQYRVELGSELAVERLDGAPGDTIRFERVLLVADGDSAQIGTPVVADALVTGEVVRQDRGEKIIVFKYRPKARHRAKKGHRQEQTVVRVADIQFGGRSAASEAQVTEQKEAKSRKAAQVEAQKKAAADAELAAKLAQTAEAAEAEESKATAKPAAKTTTKAAAKPPAKASAKPKSTTAPTSSAKPATAKSDTKAVAAKPAAKPKATTQPPKKTTAAKPAADPEKE